MLPVQCRARDSLFCYEMSLRAISEFMTQKISRNLLLCKELPAKWIVFILQHVTGALVLLTKAVTISEYL